MQPPHSLSTRLTTLIKHFACAQAELRRTMMRRSVHEAIHAEPHASNQEPRQQMGDLLP